MDNARAMANIYPPYPKIHQRAKFPFLRRKETISAGIFIGWDHLQTVNLAPIVPTSILNFGIQTQGGLRAGPDDWECRYLEASGGLAEIMFQKAAHAFPASNPARVRIGFIFRSKGFVAKRLMRPLGVIKFHIVADCQTQRFFSDGNKAVRHAESNVERIMVY